MNGFSLLEVLVTLFIITVLVSISYPIYSQHIITERRLEAVGMLSKLAIALEEYRIENNSYQGATLEQLKIPRVMADNNYQIVIQTIMEDHYQISALPVGKQAEKDIDCGILTLHSNGEKSISGSAKIENCW